MGQEEYQNDQYVFGFPDRFVNVMLLTVEFLVVSVGGLKVQISLSQISFRAKFDQNSLL